MWLKCNLWEHIRYTKIRVRCNLVRTISRNGIINFAYVNVNCKMKNGNASKNKNKIEQRCEISNERRENWREEMKKKETVSCARNMSNVFNCNWISERQRDNEIKNEWKNKNKTLDKTLNEIWLACNLYLLPMNVFRIFGNPELKRNLNQMTEI